jgi:hypothetical protein
MQRSLDRTNHEGNSFWCDEHAPTTPSFAAILVTDLVHGKSLQRGKCDHHLTSALNILADSTPHGFEP